MSTEKCFLIFELFLRPVLHSEAELPPWCQNKTAFTGPCVILLRVKLVTFYPGNIFISLNNNKKKKHTVSWRIKTDRQWFKERKHVRFWTLCKLVVSESQSKGIYLYKKETNQNDCHGDLTDLVSVDLLKSTEVIQKWNIALRFGGSVTAVQDWQTKICPESFSLSRFSQNTNVTSAPKELHETLRQNITEQCDFIRVVSISD